MMGRTEPMKDGMELDGLCKNHNVVGWKSGTRKYIKRKYNKRVRRVTKRILEECLDE